MPARNPGGPRQQQERCPRSKDQHVVSESRISLVRVAHALPAANFKLCFLCVGLPLVSFAAHSLPAANFKQCILRAGLPQVTKAARSRLAGMEDTLQLD